jgi:small subunit ribosomal protein S17
MTEATDIINGASEQSAKAVFVSKRSGDKSVTVMLRDLVKHVAYEKYIRRERKLAVHDPKNVAQVGDLVEIVPCRPVSKRKRWRVARVLRRANDKSAQ